MIDNIDFLLTLGGDGTVLWTSGMFRDAPAPPMISFALGSLGFMTPFTFDHFEPVLERALTGEIPILVRHRLHAEVVRAPGNRGAGGDAEWHREVLNEVVLDRGPHPVLTNLVVKADGYFVTRAQGDGLIIATPSGSTAYSLAAGGSMVHPTVPCMLMTPVCPHSLSFRPVLFPEHISLTVEVPQGARSEVYCSFDGKDRQPLYPGDCVRVRLSRYPVPVVCQIDATHDWFLTVRDTLHWNRRKEQGARDAPGAAAGS